MTRRRSGAVRPGRGRARPSSGASLTARAVRRELLAMLGPDVGKLAIDAFEAAVRRAVDEVLRPQLMALLNPRWRHRRTPDDTHTATLPNLFQAVLPGVDMTPSVAELGRDQAEQPPSSATTSPTTPSSRSRATTRRKRRG